MLLENLEKEVSSFTIHLDDYEKNLSISETENKELKIKIETLDEQLKRTISEASETAAEEVRCLKVNGSNMVP